VEVPRNILSVEGPRRQAVEVRHEKDKYSSGLQYSCRFREVPFWPVNVLENCPGRDRVIGFVGYIERAELLPPDLEVRDYLGAVRDLDAFDVPASPHHVPGKVAVGTSDVQQASLVAKCRLDDFGLDRVALLVVFVLF